MATIEIVNSVVESVYVGTTTISNPILIMEVDGVVIPGNYIVQVIGASRRYIFPRNNANNIYITSISVVYGNDLPSISKNIRIYVAEAS